MESSAKNRGASVYVFPNNVKIAGWASTIIMVATGTTRSEAYFTDFWKTVFSVSGSLR